MENQPSLAHVELRGAHIQLLFSGLEILGFHVCCCLRGPRGLLGGTYSRHLCHRGCLRFTRRLSYGIALRHRFLRSCFRRRSGLDCSGQRRIILSEVPLCLERALLGGATRLDELLGLVLIPLLGRLLLLRNPTRGLLSARYRRLGLQRTLAPLICLPLRRVHPQIRLAVARGRIGHRRTASVCRLLHRQPRNLQPLYQAIALAAVLEPLGLECCNPSLHLCHARTAHC